MYLVTGGAGFIGSNVVAHLSDLGEETVVCDWLRTDHRWKNLAKHEVAAVISPPDLPGWLAEHPGAFTAVVHMGAVSATTETDIDHLVESNIRFTLDLLEWCTRTQTRFIYASSAATYGDGEAGFDDDCTPAGLARLRPLNAYGWSKHVVDRRIARLTEQGRPLPPQCVGLKFFNVYGPNEYHKGRMQSVIGQNVMQVMMGEPLRLFRSQRPDYEDGGQRRDFIYIKDCVDIIAWALQNSSVSGIFNVGCGRARSWRDLAQAMFAAVNRSPLIEFIDMPPELSGKYQYFTEARMSRLRAAGYCKAFTELESGVREYIRDYLSTSDPYR